MAYELLITQAAHEDLEDALEYIAVHLSNPAAAAKLRNLVEECYQQLIQFPLLYESCQDLRLNQMGYRKVTIGNFILVYRPDQAEEKVYILRFFYGSRDYEKLL